MLDHASFKPLIPYMQSYAVKQLNGDRYSDESIQLELYANDVMGRVGEIEDSIASLRLSKDFIRNIYSSSLDDLRVYRYHYENFLLRTIGLVDRAHLLVGTSFLLDKSKLERIGAKKFIQNEIKLIDESIYLKLLSISKYANKYEKPRNEVIHSKAFSNRKLNLLMAVHTFKLKPSDIDVESLVHAHISAGSEEIDEAITQFQFELNELFNVLAPTYSSLVTGI